MQPLHLAIIWHHHQPYYADDVADEVEMPWVRLHGSKDYWGMATHLEQHPGIRLTVNLVPSLVLQLLDYAEHGREDRLLRISRIPADSLSRDEAMYLLEQGFMANLDHMIRPQPRYYELWRLRGPQFRQPERALRRFRTQDLRDLQVWTNLAWIHPIAFEQDPELDELRRKERYYTEEEKLWILERQLELVREVLPKYRALMERAQIEISTSPFFHPILPLLLDRRLARAAAPELPLPAYEGGYPEDARWHVQEALEYMQSVLGKRPVGMWPSEGAVCEQMVPLLADQGVRWIATDEEILTRSVDGRVGREPDTGYVRNPHLLYRPWRIAVDGRQLDVLFRDRALSDLIGFHYQKVDPQSAATDFLNKLHAIRHAVNSGPPPLVTVVLDGENSWEYYPGGGVAFLRTLYGELQRADWVRTSAVSDYLTQYPPEETLPRLFPGSWVDHSFNIWIGHEEDRRAWELLDRTRRHLVDAHRQGRGDQSVHARAWREIYIAEGSDWFWWFGDEHVTAQRDLFDYLFRKHLQNVYALLGDTVPAELLQPIHEEQRIEPYSQPTALLDVRADGQPRFFEWTGAGVYVANGVKNTTSRLGQLCTALWFGFSRDWLHVRIDTAEPARDALRSVDVIRVVVLQPLETTIELVQPTATSHSIRINQAGRRVSAESSVRFGIDAVLELSVPLELLRAAPGAEVSFFVELFQGPTSVDRVPREGTIETHVPQEDFEVAMWLA